MRVDDAVDLPQIATPGSPASGRSLIYPKSDGQWYTKNNAGTEVLVGSKLVPTPGTSTDAANKAYVDAAVSAVAAVGQERGYASRTTNFTSTNATLFSTAAGAVISSLSVTVTGTGRAHDIEFFTPGISHSANVIVTTYLIVNGATGNGNSQFQNWVTTFGQGGSMRQRLILTNAVSYTFTIGVAGATAGTTTVSGNTAGQMWLGVVER